MSRELVHKAQKGDRKAFGELARLYAPAVTGAVLSRISNFQETEDLVQETFARALTRLTKLRDPDRIGSWLYGIALNVAREHLRKKPPTAKLEAVAAKESAEPGDPERLQNCLQKLPAPLRALFILRHIQSISYGEISRMQKISVPSVGERLWKARRLMRQCLEAGDYFHEPELQRS